MRHRSKLKKLGLGYSHRNALLKNLLASLVLHGRLRTTAARAKALAAKIDRVMRIVRTKEAREAIRALPKYCFDKKASIKIMQELKPKYEKRNSGFTRILPVGVRDGDNAKLVQIELI